MFGPHPPTADIELLASDIGVPSTVNGAAVS
jgi:hypothetical protein